jgi:hypothetical protein
MVRREVMPLYLHNRVQVSAGSEPAVKVMDILVYFPRANADGVWS